MKISTAYFGAQDVDPESVIVFPAGLSGFEQCTRFKLFHEQDKPTVFWLQSLDDPDVTFSVVPPELFDLFYEFELSDGESRQIELADPQHAAVLLVLVRSDEGEELQEAETGVKIRANLLGPLVLNLEKRLGLQKVLTRVQQSTLLRGE